MRSDAREAAFKIIYAETFNNECDDRFKASVFKKMTLNEEDTAFAMRLVKLVEENSDAFSQTLTERVQPFDYRINAVDRAILYVALAEINYCDDVPNVVSINEAVALARKFSTETSIGFVNGVLAGVINQ